MRWKEALWLTVTVNVACGLHLTIDTNLNGQINQEIERPIVVPENPMLIDDDLNAETLSNDENSADASSTTERVSQERNDITAESENEGDNSDTNNNISDNTEANGSGQPASSSGDENASATTNSPHDNISETSEENTSNGSEDVLNPESEENIIISRSIEVGLSVDPGDIITTEHGDVQGYYLLESTVIRVQRFIDIPYGTVTGLFTAPTEPQPWTSVVGSVEHEKRCPQLQDGILVGDLDCLTLSVFVPEGAENAAVLLHIHDGDFTSGSGDPAIYGPEHLANKGVILVLPNYRLGPLGFISLQNELAPGNAALKDLNLALTWTKNNIEAFGGNPSNIAVSGDGTAGALAGYLAISPISKEHISHVIVESGSVLAHWAIDRDPIAKATAVAKLVATDSTSGEDLDFYKTTDVQTVIRAAKDVKFKPCVETHEGSDAFIKETPWSILSNNETKIEVSFMIGSANHAGMHNALALSAEEISAINEDFTKSLPNDLKFKDNDEMSDVAGTLKQRYFGESAINAQNVDRLSRYYTDASYLGSTMRVARCLVSRGATVFLYEFSFLGAYNRQHNALSSSIDGAARGDIVGYVFTQDGELPDPNTSEERTINWITELWSSFIQTGTPSVDVVEEWQELQIGEDTNESWLSIGSEITPQEGLHVERIKLWTDIYEQNFIERNSASKAKLTWLIYLQLIALAIINPCKFL